MTTIRKRGRLHSRFALTSMELYQAWSTVEFNANVDAKAALQVYFDLRNAIKQ